MARFGVKEVCDVIFYDLVTGKPALFLDSLKMSNLENNADTTYLQGGKSNARIMAFDYNRTATFTLQDALMNPTSISMQTGSTVVKGIKSVHKREVLTAVTSQTVGKTEVTLSKLPSNGVPITVYKTTDGNGHDSEVTTGAISTGQVFQFPVADVVANSQVIMYYKYDTSANTEQVIISSDKYSGFYKVVGQTIIRNVSTGLDEPFEIEVPKAKIMSNWTLNMSPAGDPAVFDMKLDVFKGNGMTDMVRLTRIV